MRGILYQFDNKTGIVNCIVKHLANFSSLLRYSEGEKTPTVFYPVTSIGNVPGSLENIGNVLPKSDCPLRWTNKANQLHQPYFSSKKQKKPRET